MSVLNRIAYFQERKDDVPNQELARDLAERQDREGIAEIAQALWNPEPGIQSDCIKVLYEIGYLDPALIAEYLDDFLKLLTNKNNRLVWGGMIALSTIAALKADALYPHVSEIKRALEQGSVITRDSAIRLLAALAAANDTYREALFPYLLERLKTCRPKEVPQYAESVVVAVNAVVKDDFARVLEGRMADMSAAQVARLRKVLRAIQ